MGLMKVRYLNVFDMSGFTHCVSVLSMMALWWFVSRNGLFKKD